MLSIFTPKLFIFMNKFNFFDYGVTDLGYSSERTTMTA